MTWRDIIPVHPAADLFPMMDDEELRALGVDIKKNGLLSPIGLWHDVNGKYRVLDGRNRLDAMEMAGVNIIKSDAKPGHVPFTDAVSWRDVVGYTKDQDPWQFVVTANIHRRHLTGEQKRDMMRSC